MYAACSPGCPSFSGGTCPGPSCPVHSGPPSNPICPATFGDKCPGPYCPAHGFNASPTVCPAATPGGGPCPGRSCPVHSPAIDRREPRIFREVKDDRLVLHIGRDDARGKPAKMILTLTSPKVIDQRLCTSSVGVQADPIPTGADTLSHASKSKSSLKSGKSGSKSNKSKPSKVSGKKKKK